ncbi:cupin domain-containing protein [Mesorhizobium sp. ANAO-SY3R2]|uniref:cupin domain-containing protein n=1 Tax=Mesorhizobium sp. ANAO-SY3R2 TaxID=3166644 RepID=UPI003671500B
MVHIDHALEEWRAGVLARMLVSARAGASQLCIFEQWVVPGAGAPIHHHPVEEVLTVMAGDAGFWLEGETLEMSAGQTLVVPAQWRHGFRNIGRSELHLHAVLASAEFEATLEGSGETIRRWGALFPDDGSAGYR